MNMNQKIKQPILKPSKPIAQLKSVIKIEVPNNTLVANAAQLDSIHRLREIQRQKKALEVLEKAEKDFLIEQIANKERLVGSDGMELATYKRDADSIKWDKNALALLYPDVFADKRCVWAEEGSMRFLLKK